MRLKRTEMGLPDLENVKVIGKGAFGEVRVAQNVDASRIYAMKSSKKYQVRPSYPLFTRCYAIWRPYFLFTLRPLLARSRPRRARCTRSPEFFLGKSRLITSLDRSMAVARTKKHPSSYEVWIRPRSRILRHHSC